jgi:hypothetical protein
MKFFFDFSQRLARTRSPFEFLGVIVEFAGKRFIMVLEHSKDWRNALSKCAGGFSITKCLPACELIAAVA